MAANQMTTNPIDWVPHIGAQTDFLQRTEFEVLFGGSSGPGKRIA
jgi:hypothetical protein